MSSNKVWINRAAGDVPVPGGWIYTPRFMDCEISEVFGWEFEMMSAGYRDDCGYYSDVDPEWVVRSKVVDA